MARFPDREAEIKALAQSIITDLTGTQIFSSLWSETLCLIK